MTGSAKQSSFSAHEVWIASSPLRAPRSDAANISE
jgi:hypothetical protein